ncbi:MAG: 2-phospho-L-lactate guanylyltransferase [Candidatus Nitrosopelagicus sp.]|nr:2-phospho-L-lactate guanylyltransferase [Candidatus Nitrosopelagicus sp.]
MKTCAIIPIKLFSKAKTRLQLSTENTKILCQVLLEEVLETISQSSHIDKILLVSKEDEAFKIGKKFDCVEIFDETESGVNNAVMLADSWISTNSFTRSVIFPQDIPFMTTHDIDTLFNFCIPENSVILVPSRHFDGTNALIRTPSDIMTTRYDEGSYRSQFDSAVIKTSHYSLALIQRIMLDIDSRDDVNFAIQKNMKPVICEKLKEIFY